MLTRHKHVYILRFFQGVLDRNFSFWITYLSHSTLFFKMLKYTEPSFWWFYFFRGSSPHFYNTDALQRKKIKLKGDSWDVNLSSLRLYLAWKNFWGHRWHAPPSLNRDNKHVSEHTLYTDLAQTENSQQERCHSWNWCSVIKQHIEILGLSLLVTRGYFPQFLSGRNKLFWKWHLNSTIFK